jgi:hypothetical protein
MNTETEGKEGQTMQNSTDRYELFVIDMYEYSGWQPAGTRATEREVVEAAKRIILDSFSGTGEAGYRQWLMFGEDVIVTAPAGAPRVEFSGRAFVKSLCGLSSD